VSPRPSVSSYVSLDVRDAIRRGDEPFAAIMASVGDLEPGQALVLRAPFEPLPLYRVLGRRGFAHWTERHADDDWSVWFYLDAPAAPAAQDGDDQTLDVRGLEPPQPMLAVLERLPALAAGETLTVIHNRRPIFLYPQLDAQGFEHHTDELEPGLVRIVIRRATP
jgi:uncharacterized protein (DUF2249 family)